MNEYEFRALQLMVIVMAQSLLKGEPFQALLAKFDRGFDTNLSIFPGVSPVESDHMTAEFQEAWKLLSRAVRMLPPE